MPVMTTLEFAGLTREVYERVGASLPGGPPEGVLYHACGPTAAGWRIVEVWESAELWDRFVDGALLPAMRARGVAAPSRREAFATHHAGVVRR